MKAVDKPQPVQLKLKNNFQRHGIQISYPVKAFNEVEKTKYKLIKKTNLLCFIYFESILNIFYWISLRIFKIS
jgi:hypothetical protein